MGITDAPRVELQQEGAPASVTLTKPSAIDTLPQHGKNYLDKQPKLPDPTSPPTRRPMASRTRRLTQREIYVGAGARSDGLALFHVTQARRRPPPVVTLPARHGPLTHPNTRPPFPPPGAALQ